MSPGCSGKGSVCAMTLQRKTTLIFGLTLLGMILAISLAARYLLFWRFDELERENAVEKLRQVEDSVRDAVMEVDQTALKYAAWEETEAFIQGKNTEYAASNLTDLALRGNQIHLALFLNEQGNVCFQKRLGAETGKTAPLPKGFLSLMKTSNTLTRHGSAQSVGRGLLALPDSVWLVASRPIAGSSGNRFGALVLGRELNASVFSESHRYLRRQIQWKRLNEKTEDSQWVDAQKALLEASGALSGVHLDAVNDDTFSAYILERDVFGRPALMLRLDMPRDVYFQKRLTRRLFVVSLCLMGMVVIGVLHFLIQGLVIMPISQLESTVREVAISGDSSRRVPSFDSKELNGLAHSINTMLRSLEHSRQALQKSEATARAMLDATSDSAWLCDLEENILRANRPLAKLLKRRLEDITGNTLESLFPADAVERLRRWFRRVCEEGHSMRFEEERDGECYEVSIQPIFNSLGQVNQIACFLRTITQECQAQRELRRSESLYREVVENVNSLVLRWDLKGRVTFINQFGLHFFGLSESEIVGQGVNAILFAQYAGDQERFQEWLKQILEDPAAPRTSRQEIRKRDGTRAWIAWSHCVMTDDRGVPREILSVGLDATPAQRLSQMEGPENGGALKPEDLQRDLQKLNRKLQNVLQSWPDDPAGEA